MTDHTAHIHLSDPDPLRRALDYWADDHDDLPDICPFCGEYLPWDSDCPCKSDWEDYDDASND